LAADGVDAGYCVCDGGGGEGVNCRGELGRHCLWN
jgi:hypothetical protein